MARRYKPDALASGGGARDEFLETARKRLARCIEREQDNRQRAKDALKFRNLEQWPDKIKRDRENDPEGARPCLTVDQINQHIQQVVNDGRQNRPAIKVRPVDDRADVKTAEAYQGIIRHIEDRSSADIAYDTAFEQSVDGGFGYWRIVTEYSDESSFEQEIRIRRIRNRFSVFLDPDHEAEEKRWGFVVERLTKEEFAEEFPGKSCVSFRDADSDLKGSWVFDDDDVLVAEYFRLIYERRNICLLSTGETIVKDEGYQVPDGVEIVKERVAKIPSVKWAKIDGNQVLEERDWAGIYIPIVEVVGAELDIEGERILKGLTHPAMDAQRIHNYAASAFVEQVALAPRSSYVAAEGQLEGHESNWRTANRRNISVLEYKPVDVNGIAVPPPERSAPPGIPVGWQAVLQNTEQWVMASMGRYAASLGQPSNEKSGKAILARQHEGDVSSFHFSDNLSRAIRHTGRILVDLIPKTYDTARAARILGEDGAPDQIQLDPESPSAYTEKKAGKKKIGIYNLGVGKYDVTVSSGPSFSTKRQEAAQVGMEILQGNPALTQIIGDIVFRSMDFPYADEIAERLKKTLPPNLQDKPDEEEEIPPQAVQMITQLRNALAELQQGKEAKAQEAEQAKSFAEAKKAEGDVMSAQNDAGKLHIERFKAETDRMKVTSDLMRAQSEIQSQGLTIENGEVVPVAQQLNQVAQGMLSGMEQLFRQFAGEIVTAINQPKTVTKQGRAFKNNDGTWSLDVTERMQ